MPEEDDKRPFWLASTKGSATPADEWARLGAERQDLYAQIKDAEILAAVREFLPQEEAGGFIAGRERPVWWHNHLPQSVSNPRRFTDARELPEVPPAPFAL